MKKLSKTRLYQIKLKKEKPAVYYSRRRAAQNKYRKTEKYRKYHREYMRRWRAKKLSTGKAL